MLDFLKLALLQLGFFVVWIELDDEWKLASSNDYLVSRVKRWTDDEQWIVVTELVDYLSWKLIILWIVLWIVVNSECITGAAHLYIRKLCQCCTSYSL